jgi:hypothetical protein
VEKPTSHRGNRPPVWRVCPECGTEFSGTKSKVYCSHRCNDRVGHRRRRALVPVAKKPSVRRIRREPTPIPKATRMEVAAWDKRLSDARLSTRRGEHSKRLRYIDPASFAFHNNSAIISLPPARAVSPMDRVSVAFLKTEQRQRTFQNRPRTEKVCQFCGAKFIAHRRTAQFCSPKCKLRNHRQKHGQTESLLQ